MKSPADPTGLPGEHGLIQRILARLPAPPPSLVVPPGDDAAVWSPPRGSLQILTTDAVVDGIHFERRFSSPADIGYRALAVNVSDIAAMGGTPHLALLSLLLPPDLDLAAIDGIIDGLLEMAAEARVTLAGGNISRTAGPLALDITVVGSVRPRRVLRRGGARPGDAVFVTGALGTAAAGLGWLRQRGDEAPPAELAGCVTRYRRPSPRVRIGALLGRTRAATACMDLSDGLGDAVRQVAEASGVGIALDGAALPLDAGARQWFAGQRRDPVAAAAASDDYELLFTVPRRRLGRLRNVIREARGIPISRIGEVTPERSVVIRSPSGPADLAPGYEHLP